MGGLFDPVLEFAGAYVLYLDSRESCSQGAFASQMVPWPIRGLSRSTKSRHPLFTLATLLTLFTFILYLLYLPYLLQTSLQVLIKPLNKVFLFYIPVGPAMCAAFPHDEPAGYVHFLESGDDGFGLLHGYHKIFVAVDDQHGRIVGTDMSDG